MEFDQLSNRVIGCALEVHRTLGPGLLESVYETCICHELTKQGIPFERQVDVPVVYDNVRLETGLRLDLRVGRSILLELKAVEELRPLHQAQLLMYMKLTGSRLGFLINFNVVKLKDGITRMVL